MKDLVPVMARVARHYLSESQTYDKMVLTALDTSAALDKLVKDTEDRFALDGEELTQMKKLVTRYNRVVTELGKRSHDTVPLWNYTIKNHVLAHVALQSESLHPKLTWCYSQESFLHHCRTLIASSRTQHG
eukprot:1666813-Amphidinium_carterae.1